MRNSVLAFLVMSLSMNAFAQQFTESDQLKINKFNAVIEDPGSHDTAMAAAFVGLSEIFAQTDLISVIPLCEKSIAVVEKALLEDQPDEVIESLSRSQALAINNIGFVHYMQGDHTQAFTLIEESLRIRRRIGHKYGIAEALGNLGNLWSGRGDISTALEVIQESKKIYEEIGSIKGAGQASGNLAYLYQITGDHGKAMEYARKSVRLYSEAGFDFGLGGQYGVIGSSHEMFGNLDSAIFYHNLAMQVSKRFEDEMGLAGATYSLGRVYQEKEEFDSALNQYESAIALHKEINNQIGISQSHRNIGAVYLKMAQRTGSTLQKNELHEKSENALLKSLEIAKSVGHANRILLAAESLTDLYEEQDNPSKTLEMYRLAIAMKDSIHNEETQEALANEQFKFEYRERKALDDAEHEKQLAIAKEREEKQKVYTYSIGGGLGLSALFLFVVFNRLRVTRKQKQIIESQKALVEESHKEITDSIHYAKRIQAAVLPPDSIVKQHLPGSFILYKPKDIVAGDFYWLEEKAGTIFFAAADCTGHGVPGAMVSVVCVSGLNRSLREMNITEPGKILDKTRELVVKEFEKSDENVQDGMDIALCSLKGKTLQYAGAHNPLWIVRNGELLETKADKQPIGKYDNPQPYTTHAVQLQEGDSIYIFSDGYPDQFGGEQGKKYKSGKFKQFLTSIADEPIRDQKKLLDREFEGWRGNHEQIDDVCVIGLKI